MNAYPTEQDGRVGQRRQVSDFKRIYSKIDVKVPLICVCGNHDVGDRPTGQSINLYKSRFGDDYFTFYVERIKFIVLNTQLYKDGCNVPDEVERQQKWLDNELVKSKSYFNILTLFIFIDLLLNENVKVVSINLDDKSLAYSFTNLIDN